MLKDTLSSLYLSSTQFVNEFIEQANDFRRLHEMRRQLNKGEQLTPDQLIDGLKTLVLTRHRLYESIYEDDYCNLDPEQDPPEKNQMWKDLTDAIDVFRLELGLVSERHTHYWHLTRESFDEYYKKWEIDTEFSKNKSVEVPWSYEDSQMKWKKEVKRLEKEAKMLEICGIPTKQENEITWLEELTKHEEDMWEDLEKEEMKRDAIHMDE